MTDKAMNRILEFFAANKLGVISTFDAVTSRPESALVGISHTENLELIFGTSNQSRKYKNIQLNPNVAFVVGWDPAEGTVQFEGVAQEISRGEEEKYVAIHAAKSPTSKKFAANPNQRYFLVKPTWIRITDNHEPASVDELAF